MSKLYDKYLYLKKNDIDSENTLLLFKSGMFYIFLDNDAKQASQLLNLKLTNLNETVLKCGFPINSLQKYTNYLSNSSFKWKIIDTSAKKPVAVIKEYKVNSNIEEIIIKLKNVNLDNLSVYEAFKFLEELQKLANQQIRRLLVYCSKL